MITRIVKMTFKQEDIDSFLEIFKVSKHKILAFDGCHHLQLLNDKTNPCIFFTFSIWDSEAHLAQYRASELFETTWAKTKKLFASKPEAWTLDRRFMGNVEG